MFYQNKHNKITTYAKDNIEIDEDINQIRLSIYSFMTTNQLRYNVT